MTISNATKIAFLGLNVLRLISFVVIILVFTTLVMGLIEDIRDYHNDAIMDEAQTDDCAYVPGTSIPMQTWGIFWVELHRALMMLGVVALFLAELSWLGISKLEHAAQVWVPVLSRTRGLAALGSVHVVIATSMLSHYLDEFPLVVSWMLFVVGACYVCLGLAFHDRPLKDGRSLFADKRKQFVKGHAPAHVYRSLGKGKDYGATTSAEKSTTTLRKLFKRKDASGKTRSAVSINETFPSLETESHKQVLADRARRAQHGRKKSSVAVDMSNVDADRSSITRDFVWNTRAGIVHERDPDTTPPHHSDWEQRNLPAQRRDSQLSHQSCATSVASSTVRIGGYTSKQASLARERAKRRRAERTHPPPAKSTGHSTKSSKAKTIKRRSMALVTTARSRLSAGTASALAARKRTSPHPARGIPNTDSEIMVEYINDQDTVPPVPPLPAYHQATREEAELPVASRFAPGGHVV
ncbi:uncharacterized protein SPSC_02778 [Sporisorium scitamineum]|uniref:Uncharacterized protein n=1 Tax=Sporisorium scitamineum TaxID=49012 RepID=A0A0F7S4R2_9BASI|nr:hypothetical protein [Sporisorium scitamineum]CDU24149.1 uncharacterized protein SPSC_02778 [Sporisorium scitamineum]